MQGTLHAGLSNSRLARRSGTAYVACAKPVIVRARRVAVSLVSFGAGVTLTRLKAAESPKLRITTGWRRQVAYHCLQCQ